MNFSLDNTFNKISFGVLVGSLILLGTTSTVDLPDFLDTILEHYITKLVFLICLVIIGNRSLPFGIIFAIIFIMMAERIVNKELEKFTN